MPTQFLRHGADSTGAKLRTYQRTETIDAASVETQVPYAVVADERGRRGVFHGNAGALTVQAAADAAGVGRWYLVNPNPSAVLVALRGVTFVSAMGASAIRVTSPRITLFAFTFTGALDTAALLTVQAKAKRKSTDSAGVATFSTANTGLTVTEGAALYSFFPTVQMNTNQSPPGVNSTSGGQNWTLTGRVEQVTLAAGEGILMRQEDAAVASDGRIYTVDLSWDEFTLNEGFA